MLSRPANAGRDVFRHVVLPQGSLTFLAIPATATIFMTVAAAPAGPAGPAGRADVAAPFRAAAPTDASFRPAPADAADAAAPGRAAALVDVPAPVFYQCCSPTSDGSVSPARPGPSGGRPPGSDGPNQRSSRCWLSRPKLGQAVCPGLLWGSQGASQATPGYV